MGEWDERSSRTARRGTWGLAGGCAFISVLTLGGFGLMIAALAITVPSCDFRFGDPGKGTDSLRLAITVTPRIDLVDGSVVRVQSKAFKANSIVAISTCLSEADTKRKGVDACDRVNGTRYAVGSSGYLDVRFTVSRLIRTGDDIHDCTERARRCLLVAADADDFDRSGGQRISFRPGQPVPADSPPKVRPITDHLPIEASPPGPYVDGDQVRLTARGFLPGEPLLVAWCDSSVETKGFLGENGIGGLCAPAERENAVAAVLGREPLYLMIRAGADGTIVVTMQAKASFIPADVGDAIAALNTDPTFVYTNESLRHDCVRQSESCWFVIAAAADTKRSGVLPYTVNG